MDYFKNKFKNDVDSTAKFSTDCIVSTKNNAEKNSIKIYPNPVIDHLVIDSAIPIIEYSLFDAFGKMIVNNNDKIDTINLTQYPSGVYFLRLFLDDYQFVTQKIVVEK